MLLSALHGGLQRKTWGATFARTSFGSDAHVENVVGACAAVTVHPGGYGGVACVCLPASILPCFASTL